MILLVSCGQCPSEILLDFGREDIDAKLYRLIEKLLKRGGWIVQHNGPIFDTYCSKKCAQ